MSIVNLTYAEKRALVEGILESDRKYFEKLYRRKLELLLELQAIDVSLNKKHAEIQGMEKQLELINLLQ